MKIIFDPKNFGTVTATTTDLTKEAERIVPRNGTLEEKLCIIHRGPGYYQLVVDKQEIVFHGINAVLYFRAHYRAMGYTLLRTGNGHSAYHPWLDLEQIGRKPT